MVDVPREIGRPVPVKCIALRGTPVPIPLDGVPEIRNIFVQSFLTLARTMEVLPGRQQTFHQKRSFDEIARIVEHIEDRQTFTRGPIHEVRPYPMVARRIP